LPFAGIRLLDRVGQGELRGGSRRQAWLVSEVA